jgi:hypothetical protein
MPSLVQKGQKYSYLHSPLTLAVEWDGQSTPHQATSPWEPQYPLLRRVAGSQASLDENGDDKISFTKWGSNPDHPAHSKSLHQLCYPCTSQDQLVLKEPCIITFIICTTECRISLLYFRTVLKHDLYNQIIKKFSQTWPCI